MEYRTNRLADGLPESRLQAAVGAKFQRAAPATVIHDTLAEVSLQLPRERGTQTTARPQCETQAVAQIVHFLVLSHHETRRSDLTDSAHLVPLLLRKRRAARKHKTQAPTAPPRTPYVLS